MRRGFEPVGKLRTGRPGRPKSLLVGPGGELYTWKRPRGRRSPPPWQMGLGNEAKVIY